MEIQIFPSHVSEEGRDGALRVLHLWNLANSVFRTSPSLSRHFIHQMFSIAREAHVEIHKNIQNRVCTQCGALKVESITTQSRSIQKKRRSGAPVQSSSIGSSLEGSIEGSVVKLKGEEAGSESERDGDDEAVKKKKKQRHTVHAKHTQLV
jgi:RNase P subunit RPR2